jgi:ribA/ribD-fused uncharacterized protein
MEKIIDKFAEEEFFLSNFYPCNLIYKGKEYKTLEHAYQAFKSENESEQEWIRNMDTPGKAKKNGQKVHIRKDWDDVKFNIMLELLRIKFSDSILSEKLINTKGYLLVEGNYWHDQIFGNCTCQYCRNIEGQNRLGKMLMQIREELINYQ